MWGGYGEVSERMFEMRAEASPLFSLSNSQKFTTSVMETWLLSLLIGRWSGLIRNGLSWSEYGQVIDWSAAVSSNERGGVDETDIHQPKSAFRESDTGKWEFSRGFATLAACHRLSPSESWPTRGSIQIASTSVWVDWLASGNWAVNVSNILYSVCEPLPQFQTLHWPSMQANIIIWEGGRRHQAAADNGNLSIMSTSLYTNHQ